MTPSRPMPSARCSSIARERHPARLTTHAWARLRRLVGSLLVLAASTLTTWTRTSVLSRALAVAAGVSWLFMHADDTKDGGAGDRWGVSYSMVSVVVPDAEL